MVRLAILLVLLCLTIWEWRAGARKVVYWLALVGLFVFFSLRYGQGTDYLTYLSIYSTVPPLHTFPNFFAYQYNKVEIGYFYLVSFFQMLGVHFSLFVAFITAFGLLGIHRFISRYGSERPIFALTCFFAVYSLTYMESSLRQLITLSITLGWVYLDWMDGKHLRAMVLALVAVTIHTSAVVLILLPLFLWNPRPLFIIEWPLKKTIIAAVLLLGAAVVINFVNLTPIIELLPGQLSYTISSYYSQSSLPSIMALGNRSLFMLIIFALAWRARENLSAREKTLFNLYCIGYGLYLLFVSFDLIASRTSVYFRIVDICLIPLLMDKNRDLVKRTVVGLPVMLGLLSFLYVKDITAIMDFAQYYSNNPLQYPYVTIFNADKIFDSKFVNVKNANAMNAYQTGGLSWDEYYQTLLRKPNNRSPIVPY